MNIDLAQVSAEVKRALYEDIGTGDVTSALLPAHRVAAEIISREPFLICGQAWVEEVFHQVDSKIRIAWQVPEGTYVDQARTLCILHGSGPHILTAERTALNFLQTLSATATQTHHYVAALKPFKTQLLDTRKTIPGLRLAQKYAVRCGGGTNHRMGLYDAFLIKENHIKAYGSISKAIQSARQMNKNLLLVVEVETLEELAQALDAGPDRILLDNFTQDMLLKAVAMNATLHCELEASGGVSIENIAAIAQSGVDFISVGAITKSIQAIDLSLLIREVL